MENNNLDNFLKGIEKEFDKIEDLSGDSNMQIAMLILSKGDPEALPMYSKVSSLRKEESIVSFGDKGIIEGSASYDKIKFFIKDHLKRDRTLLNEDGKIKHLYLVRWDNLDYKDLYCLVDDQSIKLVEDGN